MSASRVQEEGARRAVGGLGKTEHFFIPSGQPIHSPRHTHPSKTDTTSQTQTGQPITTGLLCRLRVVAGTGAPALAPAPAPRQMPPRRSSTHCSCEGHTHRLSASQVAGCSRDEGQPMTPQRVHTMQNMCMLHERFACACGLLEHVCVYLAGRHTDLSAINHTKNAQKR